MVLWPMYQNQLELLGFFRRKTGGVPSTLLIKRHQVQGCQENANTQAESSSLGMKCSHSSDSQCTGTSTCTVYIRSEAHAFFHPFSLASWSRTPQLWSLSHHGTMSCGEMDQRMLCATPEKDACALHAPTCSLSRRQWSYEWWCVLYMYCNSNSHDNKWIQMTILYTYYLSSKIHQ